LGFSAIFWAANTPNSTNDADWYAGVLRQGGDYQINAIQPDRYSINSWLNIPQVTVPEALYSSRFMGTAYTFISRSYFPHCAGGGPDCLMGDQMLLPDQYVASSDGRFHLTYQGDGNLVLRDQASFPIWSSATFGTPAGQTVMQGDGNLVVYDPSWQAHWSSNTYGHPGAYLVIQNDGNAVIYSPSGPPLWASGTGGR
jgi:hypothetical protein